MSNKKSVKFSDVLGNRDEGNEAQEDQRVYGNDTSHLFAHLDEVKQQSQIITQTGQGQVQLAEGIIGSAAGLTIPDNIARETMTALHELLFSMEGRLQLWIGDALNMTETLQYGDIKAIAEEFGREPKTLTNWKLICSNVEMSLRRDILEKYPTNPLTIGHYSIVQAMEQSEQRKWLLKAAEESWSISTLRKEIKTSQKVKIDSLPLFDIPEKIQRRHEQAKNEVSRAVARGSELAARTEAGYRLTGDERDEILTIKRRLHDMANSLGSLLDNAPDNN